MDEVIICGGGLGGLTAAAALAQRGIPCQILEKATAFGEVGAGIQIAPNAFRVLDDLGIMERLKKYCVFIDSLRMMSAVSGENITHIDLGARFNERFGYPYAVVHRAEFHRVLVELCEKNPLIRTRLNSEVIDFEQFDTCVKVTLKDGTIVQGSILVGADGLHSNIRSKIVNDGDPLVSGQSTFRAIVAADDMPEDLRLNAATLWSGPKLHAVHYPLSGAKMYNLVANCEEGLTEPLRGAPVSAEKVQSYFAEAAPVLQDLISRGQNWKQWVLCDRDPVMDWGNGRVVLLGDAAHPMLQYFAQGACMAIEDAMTLAQTLQEIPNDVPRALHTYQDRRFTRTARVQKQSRNIGAYLCHADGEMAEYRDRNLTGRCQDDWYGRLEWLYGQAISYGKPSKVDPVPQRLLEMAR